MGVEALRLDLCSNSSSRDGCVSVREMWLSAGGARDSPKVTPEGFIEKLGELLEPDDIIEAGPRQGAIKRQRKVDLSGLVQATVVAMSPIPGTETSAFVN